MHANDQTQTSEGKKPTPSTAKAPARGAGTPAGLLALQNSAGNTATIQMLRAAGHPWAQEQHQHGAGCGHRQTQQAGQPSVQRSAVHDVLRSGGRPLDDATRTDMEGRLGADFSDVRIHNDSAAKASAAEVGARAYTSGNHVVIGDGGSDKHTLAHELTHVIQQRQGPVAGTDTGDGLKVSDPSDRFEREAEANAKRAMHGAVPMAHSPAFDQRQQNAPAVGSVQRTLGQNNSTAGVDHAQGEHVFNDVATLIGDFRNGLRTIGGQIPPWLTAGHGAHQSDEKKRRIVAKLRAASGEMAGLSEAVAAALNTHRRHHQYGTVASGLGDDNNAEVFGQYKFDILALLNDCRPTRLFLGNQAPRSLTQLRSARDASIIDLPALGHVRDQFGEAVVNAWYDPAKTAMDTAFDHIFTALGHMLEIKNILAEEEAEEA